ncbi:MAG: hypothetical protein DCC58_06625 [Chloroflexi bacterium]|nr:MAG: hypothetical protein DCC58_06625 [Chloroflexota bacterium]
MGRRVALVASVLLLAAFTRAAAAPPANDAFQRTWARTDKPVADLVVSRTWMWGPDAFTGPLTEPYAEGPNGSRTVQYFDKSRMEITHPDAPDDGLWYVTNGLLVVELMTGEMQVGDAAFQQRLPSQANVAGDADDPTGPGYHTMAMVRDAAPLADGELITWRIARDGSLTHDPTLAVYDVRAAHRVIVPWIDHQVASPFWAFMNSSGLVYEGGQYVTAPLFVDPFYATGYPVTEAYWANVKVGGVYRDVLLQCFERRCLTYTPGNPPGWQVEAGNVGQHYHYWRYVETAPVVPAYTFSGSLGGPWDPATLMNAPHGIAQDSQGNIYVSDTGNNRIQKYDPHGVFLTQWGQPGALDGQFASPGGIAVDSQGKVYVADRGNHRIQAFDSAGNWLWSADTVDAGGPVLHQIGTPEDVAVGGGFIWISDSGRDQLLGLPLTGAGIGVVGDTNVLHDPLGITWDESRSTVWVADAGDVQLEPFNTSGTHLAPAFLVPGAQSITDVMVHATTGEVYVLDSAGGAVWVAPVVGSSGMLFGGVGDTLGRFNQPMALVQATIADTVWIADTGNSRVQRLSLSGVAYETLRDNRRGRYFFPGGIVYSPALPYLLVADTGLSRIQGVAPNGSFWTDWGAGTTVPVGEPVLLFPADVTANSTGALWVADTFNNRIIEYSQWGEYVRHWGTAGTGPGQFDGPLSVAADGAGNIYVADSGNHRIQMFDSQGNFITAWGGHGTLLGAFDRPTGVAVSGNDVYVVDQGNHRVQRFDQQGNFAGTWGEFGSGPGQFNTPADIAIAPDGNVYVADALNHRVQAFTPDGTFLAAWGSSGSGPTQFTTPIDIAFSPTGDTMYVTDRDNHRIQLLTRLNP